MPFIRRANDFIANPDRSLPRWREMQETLRFLINQPAPISSDTVINHLATLRLPIEFTAWQQEVLTPLRDRRIFIGSSNRGVFIIRTRDDAIDCYRFYARRILAEAKHLGILADLINEAEWNFPNINVE